MANVLVQESSLHNIAEAIRYKNGTENTYKPSEMANAIREISGGGSEPTISPLSVTANGTYTAPTGVDGYSPVTVNVSGGGSTLGTKTITENGTYNASSDSLDGYSSVTVNVSGGGSLPPKILGSYYKDNDCIIEVYGNHVKVESIKNKTGPVLNLRQLGTNLNNTTWFSILANSVVTITYSNVINNSNLTWNANFKNAGTTTSMEYGIGNDAHLSGASVTVTPTVDEEIGCLFLYIAVFVIGDVLEFDVTITIDGVRIL